MPSKGSTALQTSVAGAEIIPVAPPEWTVGYHFKHFELDNDQDCTISINGGDPIFLKAGQGYKKPEHIREDISSFKIIEVDITYNWIGYY